MRRAESDRIGRAGSETTVLKYNTDYGYREDAMAEAGSLSIISILVDDIDRADIALVGVYIVVLAIFVLIVLFRKEASNNERMLEVLSIVFGSSLGVCAGYFIGSVGKESAQYLAVGNAVWGFVSGYVLSKIKPLFSGFISSAEKLVD
jgi:FtsH-binding integral membrane protein